MRPAKVADVIRIIIFSLPFLTTKVSIFIPIITSLLFILTMAQLFKTSFSDPGVLPRASTREVVERERNEIGAIIDACD